MAKYLDSTGLTHLWAKIKSYVSTYITNLNLGGTYVAKEDGKGLSENDYTTTEKNKLAGIAAGAEVNVNADWNASSGDAQILNKPSIPSSAADIGAVATSAVGAASGVCPLDANQKVPAANLPSYVDDVVEAYARSGQTALSSTWLATGSASGTVITPETGKIYVLMADSGDYAANTQFRWGGTAYVKLNDGGVSAITNAEIDSITSN